MNDLAQLKQYNSESKNEDSQYDKIEVITNQPPPKPPLKKGRLARGSTRTLDAAKQYADKTKPSSDTQSLKIDTVSNKQDDSPNKSPYKQSLMQSPSANHSISDQGEFQ